LHLALEVLVVGIVVVATLGDDLLSMTCQGRSKYAGDAYRSLPLRHFAALADVEGVQLVSLQKGLRRLHRHRSGGPEPGPGHLFGQCDRAPGRRDGPAGVGGAEHGLRLAMAVGPGGQGGEFETSLFRRPNATGL
jgi:hypothetical protein